MDVRAYLERINYHGPTDPTLQTLRALHKAHIEAVPFENLDIPSGRWINIDTESLFDKIVKQRRGGFCFELNGAFAALLEALGYKVDRLSARMRNEAGGFGMEFGHLTLMVHLEERWLTDVTVSLYEPIRIDERGEQVQDRGRYRIVEDGTNLIYQHYLDGEWIPHFRFSLQAYQMADFLEACKYTQTSPESWFTQRRVCSRVTPQGRVTLSDMKLIITSGGGKEEYPLEDDADYHRALWEHFGIVLPKPVTTSAPAASSAGVRTPPGAVYPMSGRAAFGSTAG